MVRKVISLQNGAGKPATTAQATPEKEKHVKALTYVIHPQGKIKKPTLSIAESVQYLSQTDPRFL